VKMERIVEAMLGRFAPVDAVQKPGAAH
jgi:hypothetical protein